MATGAEVTADNCPSSILLDQVRPAAQARDEVQPDQAVEVTDDCDALSGCVPGSHQGKCFHVAIARPGNFPIQEVEAVNSSHGDLRGQEEREPLFVDRAKPEGADILSRMENPGLQSSALK